MKKLKCWKWSVGIKTDTGEKFIVPQSSLKEALKDVKIGTKHSNFKEIKLIKKKC